MLNQKAVNRGDTVPQRFSLLYGPDLLESGGFHVKIVRTYRARLRMTRQAHRCLDVEFRAQARLYNAALQEGRDAWRMNRKTVSFAEQSRQLTGVRRDDPAHASVHRTIQVETLRRLDRAFQPFFRRVKNGETSDFPRFRSSRRYRTLICDNNV